MNELAGLVALAAPVCPPPTGAELEMVDDFAADVRRALLARIEACAWTVWSAMGDPPVPADAQVWSEIAPAGGSFTFSPGARYAVLAAVTSKATLAQVTDRLSAKGFSVSYSWTTGQASRGLYCVDTWLGELPAAPSGQAWVYLEADYSGAAADVEAVSYTWGVWPVTIDIYSIAHVFQSLPAASATNSFDCVTGGTTPAGPAVVAPVAVPSKTPYVVGGAVAGSLATLLIRAMV